MVSTDTFGTFPPPLFNYTDIYPTTLLWTSLCNDITHFILEIRVTQGYIMVKIGPFGTVFHR